MVSDKTKKKEPAYKCGLHIYKNIIKKNEGCYDNLLSKWLNEVLVNETNTCNS